MTDVTSTILIKPVAGLPLTVKAGTVLANMTADPKAPNNIAVHDAAKVKLVGTAPNYQIVAAVDLTGTFNLFVSLAEPCTIILGGTVVVPPPPPPPPSGNWPGQAGNHVGFAAAPGYPGSLTAGGSITSGTAGSPRVYSFRDFIDGVSLDGVHDIKLVGCRFQSNSVDYVNVFVGAGKNITFDYCSFTPKASLYAHPPGAAWPSASAGMNTTSFVTDVNCVDGNKGYQFAIVLNSSSGPVTCTHCDFWGFGNAVQFQDSTAAIVLDNCWFHDAANDQPQGYHTDGPGYLNGGTPPQNVTLNHCTIASLGNTNGIAWQESSSPYRNITMTANYLSGFGYTAALFLPGNGGAANCTFQDNVFGSDIQAVWGPIYENPSAMFTNSTNKWRGNKFKFCPGTHKASGAMFAFSAANDGQFIWPDSSMHATDWTH